MCVNETDGENERMRGGREKVHERGGEGIRETRKLGRERDG